MPKKQIVGFIWTHFLPKPRRTSPGFSLLEILVTVAIVAIITAITIPNFRNFSAFLTFNSTRSDLISVLRKAQSNAQSGMTCSNKQRAFSWEVILIGTNYQLVPNCNGVTDAAKTFTYPAEISMQPITSCTLNPNIASIVFTSNKVEIYCYQMDGVAKISPPLASPLTIILRSSKVSPDQNITISQGGNFSFN